jgi:putative peptide zinc metalloprotease protein
MPLTLAPPNKRSLPRMRPDLVLAVQGRRGERTWTVKDPVRLRYFQLAEEEYAVLRWLDGQANEREVRRKFERQFAPRQLSPFGLQSYVAQLHSQGLLLADAPEQGSELLQRNRHRRRWERASFALQLLAIRFRGFDPESLLDRLAPLIKVLFSRTMALVVACLCLSAGLLVATHFEMAQLQAPTVSAFFSGRNAWLIVVAVSLLKVLHEFGHALASRRYGGECHEMGVMLLAGIPCLYCNVSDAWLLPNRWQRIVIGAAGMYVELFVAALATFAWWYSEPGWGHAFCWNLLVVASINTLLVNGNPLLRYDGYFILSDLTGVPNLWRQSQELLRATLARWCLGIELYAERWLPARRRAWLLAYALGAAAYRWAIMLGILWFVYQFLAARRLQPVAHLIVVFSIAGMLWGPVMGLFHLLKDPARRQQVSRGRPLFSLALLGSLTLAVLLVPFPYRVSAVAIIEPAAAAKVYVTVPGKLGDVLPVGTKVSAGTALATLASDELDLELARLASEATRQRLLVAGLKSRRETAQLPAAEAALVDFEEQLATRQKDRKALTLKAPRAGEILPPPALPKVPSARGELHSWSGTPLDEQNRGAYLTTGTLFCSIGQASELEAVLSISQDDVELVAVGQPVRLWLDESPMEIVQGEVVELARIDVRVAPRDWAMQDREPTRTDASGTLRPLETRYMARVKLADSDRAVPLRLRTGGEAKITARSRSLAWRCWRFLQRTFRLGTVPE